MSNITVKGKPFVFKGVANVENCATSQDVMEAAGLDFTVEKCPLYAKMPESPNDAKDDSVLRWDGDVYRRCPSAYATYRTDTNEPLGTVKSKYTVVQNIDAFKFFDGAIGKNKAIWQTAGCFGFGSRVFVSAKLPRNIMVKGDPVENYLVFTNNHDGMGGVKILFTPIRVICQNTLNAAIKTSNNYVSFRHTKSVHNNIDIASEILGITDKTTQFLNAKFNRMAEIKMTDANAEDVFANVILTENELTTIKQTGHTVHQIINRDWRAIDDAGISMKKVNVLNGIQHYYHEGPGQKEQLGNAWGVYNAITGYYSNIDNNEGDKRMDTLLYGDRATKFKTASDLILEAYN